MSQVKRKKKETVIKTKKAIQETNASIIKAHASQKLPTSQTSSSMKQLADSMHKNNDPEGSRSVTPVHGLKTHYLDDADLTDLKSEDDDRLGNDDRYDDDDRQLESRKEITNNDDTLQRALDEIEELKHSLARERELRIKATQVANALKAKCNKHDDKKFSRAGENQVGENPDGSYDGLMPRENLNSQSLNSQPSHNDSVTFPIRKISLSSGIRVKKSALDYAYDQEKPHKFVCSLLTTVYGYKRLADGCVKQTKKIPANQKPLDKKRINVVKYHFRNYLQQWKYPPIVVAQYIRSVHTLANRAIVAAQKHQKLIVKHNLPLDDSEGEEGDEEETVEL